MAKAFVKIQVMILTAAVIFSCPALYGCRLSNGDEGLWENALFKSDATVGEGAKRIGLYVSAGGKSVLITINTDEAKLGKALSDSNLVEGREGPYGLFIETVNGIEAVYEKNKSWWCLYGVSENGTRETMNTGIDSIEIKDRDCFELKYMTG